MGTNAVARVTAAARVGRAGARPFERTAGTLFVALGGNEFTDRVSNDCRAVLSSLTTTGIVIKDRPAAVDCNDAQEFAAARARGFFGARIGRRRVAACA